MGDTPTNMKAVQSSLRDEIVAQRQADDVAHGAILDKLHAYETELKVANARNEEKDKAEVRLRRQVFALSIAFLSILAGLIAWAAVEFRELHRDVADNTAHFREFQAIGIEWGDAIDLRHDSLKERVIRMEMRLFGKPQEKE